MSVYLTGDKHGQFESIYKFIDKMDLGKDDTIIVLGDMGLFWRKDKVDAKANIEIYEQRCDETMLYFIDGNHENFDLLKQLPKSDESEDIKYVSKHIRYLSRDTVFTIAGKKCLCLGGADSVDRGRRIPHLSWWKDEQITQKDIDLVPYDHYDYVFTHCCPSSVLNEYKAILTDPMFNQNNLDHTSEDRLEEVKNFVEFDKWYFGHYHQDVHLNDKFICLYNSFERID